MRGRTGEDGVLKRPQIRKSEGGWGAGGAPEEIKQKAKRGSEAICKK